VSGEIVQDDLNLLPGWAQREKNKVPDASVRLRKRGVSTLIEEVFVDVDSSAGERILTPHCHVS
jgi:hypothetical protein